MTRWCVTRLCVTALVLWACSCGYTGRVPTWLQLWVAANSQAAMSPSTRLCLEWGTSWNAGAKAHSNPLRVFGAEGRPYGEALARCVWFVGDPNQPGYGCYRGLIDTSLRIWQTPRLVNCQHPWAGKLERVKPIA